MAGELWDKFSDGLIDHNVVGVTFLKNSPSLGIEYLILGGKYFAYARALRPDIHSFVEKEDEEKLSDGEQWKKGIQEYQSREVKSIEERLFLLAQRLERDLSIRRVVEREDTNIHMYNEGIVVRYQQIYTEIDRIRLSEKLKVFNHIKDGKNTSSTIDDFLNENPPENHQNS